MDNTDTDFIIGKLFKVLLNSFNRTLNIGFDNDIELLHFALLERGEEIVKCNLVVCLELLLLFLLLSLFNKLPCKLFVRNGVKAVAGVGRFRKTGDFNGYGRACLLESPALFVDHYADAADCRACNDDIARTQRAVLNKQGCNGTASLIEPCFNDNALCGSVRVRFKL